jgi:hypothetical protein
LFAATDTNKEAVSSRLQESAQEMNTSLAEMRVDLFPVRREKCSKDYEKGESH